MVPYFRVKRRTRGEGDKWDRLRRVFARKYRAPVRRAELLSAVKRAKIHLLPTKQSLCQKFIEFSSMLVLNPVKSRD